MLMNNSKKWHFQKHKLKELLVLKPANLCGLDSVPQFVLLEKVYSSLCIKLFIYSLNHLINLTKNLHQLGLVYYMLSILIKIRKKIATKFLF